MQVEARLFRFDRDITSEDAVAAIKTADADHPWEFAAIEHLLSFGATHPDEQRRYPIVALGSTAEVDCRRYVPFLYRASGKRDLGLGWWDGGYRFLAVRNRSAGA